MELNNLLDKIKNQEEEPRKFLALGITDDFVQTAVWQVKNSRTEVVSLGTAERWNDSDSESLTHAVDKSLTKAVESLQEDPNELVFGLPPHWVKDDEIVPEKKVLIKKLSKDLELKPLGFVVLTESLIRYLKIREGTPTSAILVQVEDTEITVTLVKLGQIIGTHSVGRSQDVAHDVEEGISRLKTTENLPSRIIVFNGTQDMEEIVQNLTSYDWQSKFKFLHLPQIEALPKDAGISAIAIAGGSEVAKSIGFDINFDEEENTTQTSPNQPSSTQSDLSHTPSSSPTIPMPDNNNLSAIGFVKNQDIKTTKPDNLQPSQPPDPPHTNPLPTSTKSSFSISPLLSKFKHLKFPKLNLKNSKRKLPKGPLTIAIIVFLTISIGVYSLLWFVSNTSITLFFEPKDLEQSLTLTISQRVSEPNIENNIIPGVSVSKQVEGEESGTSTGSNLVGDLASGEVTLFNRTSLEKTLKSGTEISYGKLVFTLDSDVTIASKSTDSNYNDIAGKTNIYITADQIGVDSNLPSDTEFLVNNFSKDSFVANNTSAFTGGTSEEVRVVSDEDLDSLRDTLLTKLQDLAQEELALESNDQTGIFIQSELSDVILEEYSADVGDSVNNFTLKMKLKTTGLAYNKSDIENLITDTVDSSIPEGFTRADLPLEVETESAEANDDEVTLDATVKIKLLPVIDLEILKKAIKGKGATELEEIFKSLPGFKRAEVLIQPKWLPPRWKSVSRNFTNITIEIKPI